jgi:hypothetical protein
MSVYNNAAADIFITAEEMSWKVDTSCFVISQLNVLLLPSASQLMTELFAI